LTPGLRGKDGKISRWDNLGGQPFVLTTWNSEEVVKEALEVVKWWMSEEVQLDFAKNGGESGLMSVMDRASWWRRFKTVTFPYVKGLLLLALLFRTIETFKIFDVVYLITAGGPGTSTETIAVYVYKIAFQFFKTSQSSALSYILLFVVIVLTNLYLYFVNRRNEEV
jgi:ABC-type sulfate transport system permease subunit